jgi:uncharacterized Zn-binding protein involved in type VI secretion
MTPDPSSANDAMIGRIRTGRFGMARAGAVASAVALLVLAGNGAPRIARAADKAVSPASADALVAEVRKSFTINGKPIPPEIFRDFGDGDLADSGAIWVTIDAAAAIGSNLYYDEIKQDGSTISQTKRGPNNVYLEGTDYSFCGTTENGLIVVLASYNGGGSGIFETLHIVDVVAARGIDLDGKVYQRINLTNVRSVILGDRWDGNIKIKKNDITIITTKTGPADDKGRPSVTITATRP